MLLSFFVFYFSVCRLMGWFILSSRSFLLCNLRQLFVASRVLFISEIQLSIFDWVFFIGSVVLCWNNLCLDQFSFLIHLAFLLLTLWIQCLVDQLSGFRGGPVIKTLPANAIDTRDKGLIPMWWRSPGVGAGNWLQYFCLENSVDRDAGGLQSRGLQRVGRD